MTVLGDRTVTARKQHYCDSCARVIHPGEKYHRWFSTYPDPYAGKTCGHCGLIWQWLYKHDPDLMSYLDDDGVDFCEYANEYEPSWAGDFRAKWAHVTVDELRVKLGIGAS